ncbi:hypothetical protein PCANC_28699 [Puccinia coronata f. sp. avenae]|uniref:Uncharacterized protein n=1 Tax=Puccinia coronata f. sp. avenae TaxID=200324 RepID=A0A2N5TIV5_9BASI|nr:hypothetical protein PCANC_28699 [Puccinia coronata f. sp. avenae]
MRTPTPDLLPLDIQLEPRFDCWLSASMHAVPPSPSPSSVTPPLPPPPSPNSNGPDATPVDPDPSTEPSDNPSDIVLIIPLPLTASPPQEAPTAPSGITSVPSPPITEQAHPPPPRKRSGRERRAPTVTGCEPGSLM